MTRQSSSSLDLSPATSVQRLLRSNWFDARLALVAIVTIGVFLRLAAWVHDRSFWVDEIYLALNITTRSFAELWQPLAHDQGAPVGFLMLVKFVSVIFGTSEMALRVVPLFAGLASLILFPKVAARLLPASGVLFATALFAITPKLIYYSSELKQYSSDVFVTLLLLDLVARRFGSQHEAVPLLRLTIVGSIAVWFSHPALFVLAGLGLVMAFDAWRQSDRGQLNRLLAVGGTWLTSFGVCYLLCLRELGKNQYLLNYWSEYFAPAPPRNFEQLGWYLRAVSWIFEGPASMTVADVSLAVPAALIFCVGIWWLSRRNTCAAGVLLAPLAMALAASALHRYPFGGRMLLFAVPLMHLGLGAGWVALRSTYGGPASVFGNAVAIAVIMAPALTSLQNTIRPNVIEDNRASVRYIAKHWQPGDCIFLSRMAVEPMAYYGRCFGLETDAIFGGVPRGDWNGQRNAINNLIGKKRVWVMITHERECDYRFLNWQLDQSGTLHDHFHAPGTEARLYDFSSFNSQ